MIRRNNSSYSSNVFLHKTPDARENYSQKTSSSNLNSRSFADRKEKGKTPIVKFQIPFINFPIPFINFQIPSDYSSSRKTPKAGENSSQKTSSFNSDSRSFADSANKGKTPVVELRDPTLREPAGFGFETPHSKRSNLSVASAVTKVPPRMYESGCLVGCLACVAKIKYKKARPDAIKYGGFIPDRGMHFEGATRVLNHWGIRNALIDKYTPGWTDFPDKAIIGVKIDWQEHAVVLRRINGKLYVYDSRQRYPVANPESHYELIVPDCYIAILDAKPRTTPPSRTEG